MILSTHIKAQSITPAINNNSGTFGVAGNIIFEFSFGESFTTTIGSNYVVTQGLLQPLSIEQSPLPVHGLQFSAKRISNSSVQLDWKTVQEINNRGFYVERKKETEGSFTQLGFVKSLAPNGNTSLPQKYWYMDTNDFTGKTYYRLKQEDIDGGFIFSIVQVVNGSTGKSISLKAWPIPSSGPVNISVEGIEKDVLMIFDNTGRLLKQEMITAKAPIQLTALTAGTYIVKLGSQKDIYQKIIIQ